MHRESPDERTEHAGQPTLGRTSRVRAQVADGVGGTHAAELVTCIDVESDPGLFEQLLRDEINVVRDPTPAQRPVPLAVPVLLHWPSHRTLFLFLPRRVSHRVLEERARLLERLATQRHAPSYMRRARVLVGLSSLRALDPETPEVVRAGPVERFRGELGQTRRRTITVRDDDGRMFDAAVYVGVDVERDPELLTALKRARLNEITSPHDNLRAPVPVAVTLHWPSERRFVLYIPPHLAERRLVEHARLLRRLSDAPVSVPRYVAECQAVVGVEALERWLSGKPMSTRSADKAAVSQDGEGTPPSVGPFRPLGDTRAQEEVVVPELPEGLVGLRPAERVGGPDTRPHETNTALYLVASAPERFPAEDASFWWDADATPHPLLAARIAGDASTRWMDSEMRLLVQLHDLDLYPIVALIVLAVSDDEIRDEIVIPLDVADERVRALLDRLAETFSVVVALYKEGGTLHDAARFSGPLSSNVRAAIDFAQRRLSQGEGLDWEAARERFASPHYPRIGDMRHPFSPRSFMDIATPSEAITAVSILSYWSQDPNQRYLLYNQSFSATWFEGIRARVIDAAIRFGIRLPSPLRRRVAPSTTDAAAVIERQLASFAEVDLQLRENDLDAVTTWENWRMLLEDAAEFGVEVDPAMRTMAQRALEAAEREVGSG